MTNEVVIPEVNIKEVIIPEVMMQEIQYFLQYSMSYLYLCRLHVS